MKIEIKTDLSSYRRSKVHFYSLINEIVIRNINEPRDKKSVPFLFLFPFSIKFFLLIAVILFFFTTNTDRQTPTWLAIG